MYQKWRTLLFLHWELPPEVLAALLPRGLELDLYEGKAYVGLVPFTMRGIRPVGLPAVRWLSDFHETNVRTYVHVNGRDPGVWFFSLDAANPVGVALARALFHLPYYHARMSLTRSADGVVTYESSRRKPGAFPVTSEISGAARGPVEPAPMGTLEHFLLERYLLYSTNRGRLYRGQVHHGPYPVQTAEVFKVEETLLRANRLHQPPVAPLAHFAEGVDVEVFGLRRVVSV
jgi:uncharacterized protein YqjF (DUF2071 family)